MVYKIFRGPEWADFQATGHFAGSADDGRDGFIHLSTAEQLQGTLDKHFAGESGLVVAELSLGDDEHLKWEESRGGQKFPHLYRALRLADVVGHRLA